MKGIVTRIILYFLGGLLFFNSCTTHKTLVNTNSTNVSAFSVEAFNGYYCNKYVDTFSSRRLLWTILDDGRSPCCKTTVYGTDSSIVSLKFEKNKLIVHLIENGTIVKEMVFKGKVKGNYISLKRKILFCNCKNVPLPFFLYKQKVLLGNMSNGNLVIKFGEDVLMVVIMGRDIYSKEYNKLNF